MMILFAFFSSICLTFFSIKISFYYSLSMFIILALLHVFSTHYSFMSLSHLITIMLLTMHIMCHKMKLIWNVNTIYTFPDPLNSEDSQMLAAARQ